MRASRTRSLLATTAAAAALAGSLIAASPASASPRLPASSRRLADSITAAELSGHIRFLADDLLEGRSPGSRGDALTQRYIASQMQAIGLQPGASATSYLQPVPLVGITPSLPKTVTLTSTSPTAKRSLSLTVRDELTISAGVQSPRAAISGAEVVFVGYGIVAPEFGWDDYAGVDVRGKVVLVMNNDPAGDPSKFGGPARLWYGRWDYKFHQAAKQGAVGAIVIHTVPSASYPWSVVQSSSGEEEFELAAGKEARLQAKMWATEDASRRIAGLGGHDLDALRAAAEKPGFRAVPLGAALSLAMTNKLRKVESANVLGVLPGRDPKLAAEAVVLTAHHDHLGVGHPVDGDAIYNGAIDNASGVGALLAIARAASKAPRPKRSILFLAVAAEEQGLLGSAWYARHPTFAPGRIAANINMDSMNRFGRTSDVGFIGFGKSSLDRDVAAIARLQGRVVKGDPAPERGAFYRSDQVNFARIGVPAVYASGGPTYVGRPPGWGKQQKEVHTAKRYHQPSDEYDPTWDLSGAVEDAQLFLLLALRVADARAMPTWNPGDEFEAARKAALAAVAGAPATKAAPTPR